MPGLNSIAIGSWVAVFLSFGTIAGSAQKDALLSFCQLSLSERLKHANLSFTDGFVFKVDKNGKPVEIRRILGKWVDDQEVVSCVSKWQFSGFEEDSRVIVTFGWKHGVGWTGMRVVSKDFSQVITNGRAPVPDCTNEEPDEQS